MAQPRVVETRRTRLNSDRDTAGSAGGNVINFKAETIGMKIGDVVVISTVTDDSVAKSAVAADGARLAGVVVGGGSNFGEDYAFFDSTAVGLGLPSGRSNQSQVVGGTVSVQFDGIAWVTAGAAIARGAIVGLDTVTAGRVITNITAGLTVGIAMRAAAAAGSVFPMLIVRR